jgi:hypothetical protein
MAATSTAMIIAPRKSSGGRSMDAADGLFRGLTGGLSSAMSAIFPAKDNTHTPAMAHHRRRRRREREELPTHLTGSLPRRAADFGELSRVGLDRFARSAAFGSAFPDAPTPFAAGRRRAAFRAAVGRGAEVVAAGAA